jgi:CysZ protein
MESQSDQTDGGRRRTPGVVDGIAAVFRGFGFVVRTPRAWLPSAVPGLLLLLLAGADTFVAVTWFRPIVVSALPTASGALGRYGVSAVAWLATALAVALGGLVALAVTPPLSAPALDRVVALQEAALSLPPRAPLGLLAELSCGLRAQMTAVAVGGPVLATLWLATLFAPPLAVVTLPLKYTAAAFLLAWGLLDYPLTLWGVGVRARGQLLRRHWRATLGFGLGFAIAFAVPCGAVVLLPAGVAGATRLLASLRASNSSPP